jgi:hypothetical protein
VANQPLVPSQEPQSMNQSAVECREIETTENSFKRFLLFRVIVSFSGRAKYKHLKLGLGANWKNAMFLHRFRAVLLV